MYTTCPHCKKDLTERGLKNWKNLFKKPDLDSFITLALIILVLYLAWAYKRDISVLRDLLANCNPISKPYFPFGNLSG